MITVSVLLSWLTFEYILISQLAHSYKLLSENEQVHHLLGRFVPLANHVETTVAFNYQGFYLRSSAQDRRGEQLFILSLKPNYLDHTFIGDIKVINKALDTDMTVDLVLRMKDNFYHTRQLGIDGIEVISFDVNGHVTLGQHQQLLRLNIKHWQSELSPDLGILKGAISHYRAEGSGGDHQVASTSDIENMHYELALNEGAPGLWSFLTHPVWSAVKAASLRVDQILLSTLLNKIQLFGVELNTKQTDLMSVDFAAGQLAMNVQNVSGYLESPHFRFELEAQNPEQSLQDIISGQWYEVMSGFKNFKTVADFERASMRVANKPLLRLADRFLYMQVKADGVDQDVRIGANYQGGKIDVDTHLLNQIKSDFGDNDVLYRLLTFLEWMGVEQSYQRVDFSVGPLSCLMPTDPVCSEVHVDVGFNSKFKAHKNMISEEVEGSVKGVILPASWMGLHHLGEPSAWKSLRYQLELKNYTHQSLVGSLLEKVREISDVLTPMRLFLVKYRFSPVITENIVLSGNLSGNHHFRWIWRSPDKKGHTGFDIIAAQENMAKWGQVWKVNFEFLGSYNLNDWFQWLIPEGKLRELLPAHRVIIDHLVQKKRFIDGVELVIPQATRRLQIDGENFWCKDRWQLDCEVSG